MMMKTWFFLLCILILSLLSCDNQQDLPCLKVSKDNRYLVTENNKPFFWLGDTAWELIHRLSREEIDTYLSDRAEKGFTIIQTVILAELYGLDSANYYGYTPLIDNNPETINEKYFELVDYTLKKAEEHGLYVALLPTWGDKFHLKWGVGPEIFTPENAEKYGEIIAGRYHNQSNIVWVLGGDRWPGNAEDTAIINAMASGIRNADSMHLITYHPTGGQKATDFFNVSWLDIDMFQTGHRQTVRDYLFVRSGRKTEPTRPVINGEPRYENHPDRSVKRFKVWMDETDVRSSAYWTMLSGAAGYTYGCHDIWQFYSEGRKPITQARTYWMESLNLPGANQMKYMKKLLTSYPFHEMNPDTTLILNKNYDGKGYMVGSISKKDDFLLIYTPQGDTIVPDLSRINSENIRARWYNPRDGKSLEIGHFPTSQSKVFVPWSHGEGSDFVLIISAL